MQNAPGTARTTATPPAVTRQAGGLGWQRQYTGWLVMLDALIITVAAFVSQQIRFGTAGHELRGMSYTTLSAALAPGWVAVLAVSRAYEPRFVGVGSDEFSRVFDASVRFLALVATVSFVFKLDLARGYVGIALPVGTVLLLLGRLGARGVLHRLRREGRAAHRVIVIGDRRAAQRVALEASRNPYAGLQVVGACVAGDPTPLVIDDEHTIPVLGTPGQVIEALQRAGADTVAVAGGWSMGPGVIRQLSWELEGTGIDLLVSPALTDVAGPRISIRPVAGLPLLHVEEPEFTGVRRVVKGAFDRTLALALVVAFSPLLVATAVAIKLDSPGPVIFRQTRVGKDGSEFCVWKFRSMLDGAAGLRAELDNINEVDGLLFKIKQDPRITRVGRVLRKYSIDELPQLWNVLRGDMSLVGPRPPLPAEVAEYERDVHRRLLVKPGMTGLWQVSGRSNLSWDETVRLDLHYVENWSVVLDFHILWKTLGAVVAGRGAY